MSVENAAKKRTQKHGADGRARGRRNAARKAKGEDPAREGRKKREIRILQLAKYYAPFYRPGVNQMSDKK